MEIRVYRKIQVCLCMYERTYVCIRVKVQINAAHPPYFQYQIQEHFFRATLPRLNLTDTTQTKRNICAGLVLSQIGLDDIGFDLRFYIENNYVSRGASDHLVKYQ